MIKQSELDSDQLLVLNSILDKSLVVSGCAGSGKSVLALIKAQRIERECGNDYQVIVYTRALCNYMNSGRRELGLSRYFSYHWIWKKRLGCPQTKYVIVDEIQDFTEEEIREFIGAGKIVFFFGDTAQSIYDGMPSDGNVPRHTMAVDDIRNLFPSGAKPKCFELYRNYRLPKAVAEFVQYIGVDLPPFVESIYQSKVKVKPHVVSYPTQQAQLEAIRDIVQNKFLTDVAILLPQNDLVRKVFDSLTSLGLNCETKFKDSQNAAQSVDSLDFTTDIPKVMTYHSAKGLQFEAVFLPCLECYNATQPSARKSLYVAATRTYKELYVMYRGPMPQVLSSIDPALYETS